MKREQVADVFKSIFDLLWGQRPLCPVGECFRFFQRGAHDLLDKLGITDLCPVANHRGSQLRIEDRGQCRAALDRENLEVLPSRVHNL